MWNLLLCAPLFICVARGDLPHCAMDGTPTQEFACQCGLASTCTLGQACDPVDNKGRGSCKTQDDKPVGGNGGSSGTADGSSGADGSGTGGGSSGADGSGGQGSLRCQSKDGALLPDAAICEDRLDGSACQTIFSNDGPGIRSSKCDLPDLAETALKCAKTCRICCERAEHGCDDDNTFGIDCLVQKSKCKDSQWTAVMSHVCPSTCGLCNAGACRDVIDGCASLKSLCRDVTYRSYMTKYCARTCHACEQDKDAPPPTTPSQAASTSTLTVHAAQCVDEGVNCGSFVHLCNDANWEETLRRNCTKTCEHC